MYVIKHTIATSGAFALLILLNAVVTSYYGPGQLSVLSTLATIALASLLVFSMGRQVSESVKDAGEFIEKVIEGDSTARLGAGSKDLSGLHSGLERLSRAVKAYEDRQREFLAAIPAAVIRLDRSGAITYMNDSAAMLTGRGTPEAQEADYTDLTPTRSHHELKEAFLAALNGETVAGREITIIDMDCHEINCEFSAVPSWKGAGPDGCFLICRDAEEKTRLESELKSARLKEEEATAKLNKTIQYLEEFSIMAVRRELKMQEIRERLTGLKKDPGPKKNPLDRTA